MNRRDVLRLGAVCGVSAIAGCNFREDDTRRTPTEREGPSPEPTDTEQVTPPDGVPYTDQYGTVVDLASQGADPEGRRSAVPLLREHAADDTLLYLPPGRYLVDEPFQMLEFENFGIVGSDATVVPPDGDSSTLFDIGRPGRASDFLIEGIEFDIRAPNTGPRPLSILSGGRVVVRDVAVTGRQDDGWGMIRIDITSPDGEGVVERLRLLDGATSATKSTGCLVGQMHRGSITFRDCTIAGFPDNGLYAEPDRGSVRVIGGYYKNNGIASLRVGNNSTVRGAKVVCDRSIPGFANMRGIRIREGRDVLVEDCTVEMSNVSESDGAVVLAPWLESAVIRNTTIRVDADEITGFLAKRPASGVNSSSKIRCEGLTIEGDASNGTAVEVQNRNGCDFREVFVFQTGVERDGFRFFQTRGASITDAQITVTGRPIVSSDSSVRRENVTLRRVDSRPG